MMMIFLNTAPRMTGILVKIFTHVLECPILGTLLLYILKGNNLTHQLISNAELGEPPLLFVLFHHFEGLRETLEMSTFCTLVYEDSEGDRMLVEDENWISHPPH
ncbi:uncharacterized protein LOC130732253 [Lotus japonicus]|uniref:uncharacterized protein LOC130732253 n=1 Tax=Lotus japonicus TaxID=34305 RepID=UPI002590D3BC|nr:uncharacterized protein LOC130732253 [Lotus japonicus]